MKIVVNDNNLIGYDASKYNIHDLRRIADCRLDKLTDSYNNELWLFPKKENRHYDKIEDKTIISLVGDKFTTGNIMGFVGCGETELTIRSRFSHSDDQDWFMQYMLQKVFAINIFDLKHGKGAEGVLNISALMFPYFLQKALLQGVYREYVRREHNDSRPRGAINFNAHIKANYPFKNGKIAYTTREYVYDNSITQLIRHTIEFLKRDSMSWELLYASKETQANIKQIINATPSYSKGDLKKIISANMKPKIHPYYSEYGPLQKLCLQILRKEKLSYGQSSERIYGILFDGAWLWEEYLNLTLAKAGFVHPENRTGKGKLYPFRDKKRYARYPDFLKDNIVADAKYKRMVDFDSACLKEDIGRDDLNQMISYLHITSSDAGIFICPTELLAVNQETGQYYPDIEFVISERDMFAYRVGELEGYGGHIYILGVNIPQSLKSYKEFIARMRETEEALFKSINQIVTENTKLDISYD